MQVEIAGVAYRLVAVPRDGRWRAYALRAGTGEQFGPDLHGATESEARDRLERWLEWQHAHSAALLELQEAQHAYHRSVSDTAFAGHESGGRAGSDTRRDALEAVDAARARLDDLRARRPR